MADSNVRTIMTLVCTEELAVLRRILCNQFEQSFPERRQVQMSGRPSRAEREFDNSRELQRQIFHWIVGLERGSHVYWADYLQKIPDVCYIAFRDYVEHLVESDYLTTAMVERWRSIKLSKS